MISWLDQIKGDIKFIGYDPAGAPILEETGFGTFNVTFSELQELHDLGYVGSYQTYENWLKLQTQRPALISSGVADLLKNSGFSDDLVDPLTKSTWTNAQVEALLDGSQSITGIVAPSQVDPTTLTVTPVEDKNQLGYETYLPSLIPIGLGLLAVLLLKD